MLGELLFVIIPLAVGVFTSVILIVLSTDTTTILLLTMYAMLLITMAANTILRADR